MDPISLAVWYLDDGSKKSDCAACRLATLNICNLETLQGFTLEENMALVECLRSNFGIEATPGGGRGRAVQPLPPKQVQELSTLWQGPRYQACSISCNDPVTTEELGGPAPIDVHHLQGLQVMLGVEGCAPPTLVDVIKAHPEYEMAALRLSRDSAASTGTHVHHMCRLSTCKCKLSACKACKGREPSLCRTSAEQGLIGCLVSFPFPEGGNGLSITRRALGLIAKMMV